MNCVSLLNKMPGSVGYILLNDLNDLSFLNISPARKWMTNLKISHLFCQHASVQLKPWIETFSQRQNNMFQSRLTFIETVIFSNTK